jgi:hypothetical protein
LKKEKMLVQKTYFLSALLVAKAQEVHQNAALLSGVTRYAVLLLGAGMALE